MSTPTKEKRTKRKLVNASNFLDFDWNKAKLFYHIAQCGSFMKTASLTGIDQPSLTRQIQTLEKQVGCPLLIRKSGAKGGVALTRKGEELLELVTPFFLDIKGFCGNHYVTVGEEKKRKIRIATTHALAAYVINDLLIQYNKEHKNLTFELLVNDHSIDVILDDVDIAIRPYAADIEGIHQEPLFTLEKKLYASKEYLAKHGEPITVEDLWHHQFLAYPTPVEYPYSDVSWILKIGMPEGKLRTPFFTSNSVECLVDAAKNGLGIMSGYEQMKIFRDSGLKIILPYLKDKKIQWYFIYPNYLKEDMEIIELKKYLNKMIKT